MTGNALLSRFQELDNAFPQNSNEFSVRLDCKKLLPDALSIIERAESTLDDSMPLALFYSKVAQFLESEGMSEQAEKLARRSLTMMQKLVKKNDIQLCKPLLILGNILWLADNSVEAESLLSLALEIAEKEFGKDSLEVAKILDSLGCALFSIDEKKCLKILNRALKIRESGLPKGHHDIATTLSNLAYVISQNDPEEAESIFRKVLKMRQAFYGDSHPDVAMSFDMLASLMSELERYEEASEFGRKAVALFTKCYQHHPDVVIALQNMGIRLHEMENYPESEIYFRRAKDVIDLVYGPRSIEMAEAWCDLAEALYNQEKLEEAEVCFRSGFNIYEETKPSNEKWAEFLNLFGCLLNENQKLDEAEVMFRCALKIAQAELEAPSETIAKISHNLADLLSEKNFNEESKSLYRLSLENCTSEREPSSIANTMHNLADLLLTMDELEEAKHYGRRALKAEEKIYGKSDQGITNSLLLLGRILKAQGRFGEAEKLYLRALEIDEAESSEDITLTLSWLGELYQDSEDLEKAIEIYRRRLSITEAKKPKDLQEIYERLDELGGVLRDADLLDEAEKIMRKALKNLESRYQEPNEHIAETCYSLGILFQDRDLYEESKSWLQRSLKNTTPNTEPIRTAYTLYALSESLMQLEDFLAAEGCIRDALKIEEELYGKVDGRIIQTSLQLAIILEAQDRDNEAESQYLQTLEIVDAISNDDLETVLSYLGSLYRKTSQWEKAVGVYRRMLDDKTKDPAVEITLKNILAIPLVELGEYDEALPLLKEALSFYESNDEDYTDELANTHLLLAKVFSDLGNAVKAKYHFDLSEELAPDDSD
jgi:tetratricopeptide (TPR) repeat protein